MAMNVSAILDGLEQHVMLVSCFSSPDRIKCYTVCGMNASLSQLKLKPVDIEGLSKLEYRVQCTVEPIRLKG